MYTYTYTCSHWHVRFTCETKAVISPGCPLPSKPDKCRIVAYNSILIPTLPVTSSYTDVSSYTIWRLIAHLIIFQNAFICSVRIRSIGRLLFIYVSQAKRLSAQIPNLLIGAKRKTWPHLPSPFLITKRSS